jgi:uncharacterized membrane protein
VTVFVTLSLLFGSLVVLVTPPLDGPDETAHFLRAYGVAQGDIVPSLRDAEDRKGVVLAPRLYAGFDFFESARVKEKEPGFSYRSVFEAYFADAPANTAPSGAFVLYAGSEGYSPIAYLPQAAAAVLARALDLTFLPTFYLMRFTGLLVLTGVIAYAIAIVPGCRWAFVAIAMLPAAFYGRSVINADGSALAAAMVVTALWLRGAIYPQHAAGGWQSLWMVLNALAKAPNVAFVLLELRLLKQRRGFRRLLLVALPAVAAAAAWTLISGADTASWRMVEITGRGPEAFDPATKLSRMIEHPLHFPLAVLGALDAGSVAELWRQTIGVLGLFDTVLLGWLYPVISLLVLASFLTPLSLAPSDRWQIPASAAVTTIAYIAVVYLISYLVFTPSDADRVWGVQGRYFIPILPLVAIMLGSFAGRGFGERATATLAMASSVLSGCASVEAILRTDWFAA